MSERATYREIKNWLLSCYFRGCQSHGFSGWTPAQVTSWAYSEFDGSYSLSIEQLMLEVCSLALTGGWYPNQVSHHRSEIQRLLMENNLDGLLEILPAEELEEFLHDLRILKLI